MTIGDTTMGGAGGDFPLTEWSLVGRIRSLSDPEFCAGFETLCRRYWKPIYRYLRMGRAKSNEEAKDLTQAFFLWAFEGETIRRYSPERGSFRTFLKVMVGSFARDHDKAEGRIKRGGDRIIVSLDDAMLEDAELKAADPDRAFDEAWALEVTRRAIDAVRTRMTARFRVFDEYALVPEDRRPSYAELGRRLDMSESDVRNTLFAMREAVRMEIRSELARTGSDPASTEKDWNELFLA